MSGRHNTARLAVYGLVSAIAFGAATPASKALLNGMHPQVLAGLLYLGAALGVLPATIASGAYRFPRQGGVRTALLLGGAILAGGVLGPVLLLLGLQMSSSGSVSLWLNLEFVATVLLGHFVFREHLSGRGWLAAAGTLVAAMVLAGGEGAIGWQAAGLVAAGCLCWGFDNHFTALIDGITPAQTTLWKGLVAGAVNLTLGCILTGTSFAGNPRGIALALAVGAVAYGLSVVLYITSAQGLGASRSQMLFSTAPFFGVLLSVLLLGEPFSPTQAVAAAIIVASLVLLFRENHAHTHRHAPLAHQHEHDHADDHHDHEHADSPTTGPHSHWHEHEPQEHAHDHWPDLHHRHGHGE